MLQRFPRNLARNARRPLAGVRIISHLGHAAPEKKSKELQAPRSDAQAFSHSGLKGLDTVRRARLLETYSRSFSATAVASPSTEVAKKKKQFGWWPWLKEQVLHLWHGSKLLALNTRIALRLKRQIMAGQKPTRRERQLLEKTTKDLLRLVPFSAFILIPGGELLLPVAVSIFPNLMPSTFTTKDQRRDRQIRDSLARGTARRRIFEHMVTQVLCSEAFSPDSKGTPLFRAMATEGLADADSIRSLSKYFNDDGPLALGRLPRYVLRDLTVVSGTSSTFSARLKRSLLPTGLYEAVARHDIDKHMEFRKTDDLSLSRVDFATLTPGEIEHECTARNLRWFGTPDALKVQLSDWISLSLDPDIPSHMLLFIQPSSVPRVMRSLTKKERDRILGLDEFRDTAQVQFLRSMSETVDTKVKEKSESIEKISTDEIKQHLEEERQELDACTHQFDDLRKTLPETVDVDLLALFDELVQKAAATDSGGNPGVEVQLLDQQIARYVSGQVWAYVGSSPQRMIEGFHEFDIDKSGVITRTDFEAFLKRIRAK